MDDAGDGAAGTDGSGDAPDGRSGEDGTVHGADGAGRAGDGADDAGDDAVADAGFHADPSALADREGWQVEGYAARVHYRGADDRYSVEYYGPSDCVLYWKVKGDGETAVPVGRATVPAPLRERIREDLAAAGIDPAAEERSL